MVLPRLIPGGAAAERERLRPDQLHKRLDTLPVENPVEAARLLGVELRRIAAAESDSRTSVKLLELVRASAERILPPIEESLGGAPLPLTPALRQAQKTAYQLLKDLGAAYLGITRRVAGRWKGLGFASLLRLAVLRAMQMHARRLELTYRGYSRGSASAWTQLHQLYGTAREGGFTRAAPDGESETPERTYIDALLLAFAEPSRLTAGELERVRFYIRSFGGLAVLQAGNPARAAGRASPGKFLVRPGEKPHARPIPKGTLNRPDDFLLDCTRLTAKLGEHIQGLESGARPETLGLPQRAGLPDYVTMLRGLARAWSAPPARRHDRLRFHPHVDAVAGFDHLWKFLAGPAFRRRAGDLGEAAAAPAEGVSEWFIANQSPGGLGLHYVGGDSSRVRVSEIFGMRLREKRALPVYIVRRALAGNRDGLDLGLEELAARAKAVTISWPGPAGMRATKVILLLHMPALDNGPGLIAAPGAAAVGTEVRLRIGSREMPVRVARRVESTASCEIFALVPVPLMT